MYPLVSAGYCLIAFLVGGIPFGYLVAMLKGIDIRTVGSGNIGATNVSRAIGKGPGFVVFLLDSAKGACPALITPLIFPRGGMSLSPHDLATVAGGCAVVGHMYSPYLRFTGGKGVATTIGTVLALAPIVAGAGFAAFVISMLISGIVSLSSLIAMPVLIGTSFLTHQTKVFDAFIIVVCLLSAFKHKENMVRIKEGTEKKFSFAKKKPEEAATDDSAS